MTVGWNCAGAVAVAVVGGCLARWWLSRTVVVVSHAELTEWSGLDERPAETTALHMAIWQPVPVRETELYHYRQCLGYMLLQASSTCPARARAGRQADRPKHIKHSRNIYICMYTVYTANPKTGNK